MFGLMFYALGENMISVEKNTSIEQIDSGWLPEDGKARFFIKADSSFQIFAEAYAVAMLREIKESGVCVEVVITNSVAIDKILNDDFDGIEHPMLSTFGLQLLFVSDEVFINDNERSDVRSVLAKNIWGYLINNKMVLGEGRKVNYISNHMHPVPTIFGGERRVKRFADYQKFKSDFSRRVSDAWSGGESISEYDLNRVSGVAFHAAENAYDHGRSDSGKSIRGYYGISLENYFFEGRESVSDRGDLTDLVRNYLADAFDNFNLGLDGKMRVQILSVFDIGNGIQKTLTKYECENEIELVKKSFDDLVTSKVDESADEQPGFGLGDIL